MIPAGQGQYGDTSRSATASPSPETPAATKKPLLLREASTDRETEMLIRTKAKLHGRYLPKDYRTQITYSSASPRLLQRRINGINPNLCPRREPRIRGNFDSALSGPNKQSVIF